MVKHIATVWAWSSVPPVREPERLRHGRWEFVHLGYPLFYLRGHPVELQRDVAQHIERTHRIHPVAEQIEVAAFQDLDRAGRSILALEELREGLVVEFRECGGWPVRIARIPKLAGTPKE